MQELDDILDYEENIQDLTEFLANKSTRFANYLVDYIFLVIIQLSLVFGSGMVEALAGNPWINLIGLVFQLLYYILGEEMFGKTPAKFITQTKVVMADGSKPPLGKIIGRSFARIVPFEAFSFLGSQPIGWHDRWTDTRVVRDEFEVRY